MINRRQFLLGAAAIGSATAIGFIPFAQSQGGKNLSHGSAQRSQKWNEFGHDFGAENVQT